MYPPSFIASSISGILIFIGLIYFLCNINTLSKDPYKLIMSLTLLGIGFGVQGISHNFLEVYYDFNPFIGKWKVKNEPEIK